MVLEFIGAFFRTQEVVQNTNFWNKGNFSSEKNYLTNFSRIIEFDKPQGTVYKGQHGLLSLTVKLIRSILRDLRGC